MVYHVVAIEVERPLVEVRRAQRTAAVQGHEVAALGIHQQPEGGVGGGIDAEVHAQVGRYLGHGRNGALHLCLGLRARTAGRGQVAEVEGLGGHVVPCDEVLAAQGFRTGRVVVENGVAVGGGVHVDQGAVVLALDAAGARGVDGATEGVVAEFLEVVGQKVVGPHADVEGEVAQSVMVHAASEQTGMSISVVDGVVAEDDMVGDEHHGIVPHGVVGVQALHEDIAVGRHLPFKVDVVEWTEEAQPAGHAGIDVAHETVCEGLQELQGGAVGQDVEVDLFVGERHVAIYVGGSGIAVGGMAVELDSVAVAVEVRLEVHLANPALAEPEIVNHQVDLCLWLVEDRGQIGVA